MAPLEPFSIAFLGAGAFAAGLVDAVVGGGGLIQFPTLFSVFPQLPPATLFGTNKIASLCGTSYATYRFAGRIAIPWAVVLPAGLAALAFSFLGAHSVTLLPKAMLRPLVLVLLIAVAIYTFWHKDFGSLDKGHVVGRRSIAVAGLVGAVLGFYDGFFGPGAGSFLIFAFIRCFGFDFLKASLSAKCVNLCTNAGALVAFGWTGHILYGVGLGMAACNVAGSWAGSYLSFRHGTGFVRVAFLVVATLLIGKFGWDTFRG
ncbi:hypothetical protein SAMN05444156_0269 [Verrucomicrobium sp. GAS474]|uniref:sulfite exporter TauE/SafE family protein n=1 Tax=Verrucomicrobium sp. GAS474 TaxID=1882831 RepID=UPI00087DCF4F|nr:TSUP family transporter [Verrucomicrobium sp. GAS474]SDT87100.1 hypothetical protein SAMN05444156_0269 [Verrucomicrobium sp. GAS474]